MSSAGVPASDVRPASPALPTAPAAPPAQGAHELTSLQRAAILFMSMDVDIAARIFGQLRDEEVEELGAAIRQTCEAPEALRHEVLADFARQLRAREAGVPAGAGAARALLEGALGRGKAQELLPDPETARSGGAAFDFLTQAGPESVAALLRF